MISQEFRNALIVACCENSTIKLSKLKSLNCNIGHKMIFNLLKLYI